MRDLFKNIMKKFTIRMDFSSQRQPILGRWALHRDETDALRKADMTNEDHCGTCDKMRYDYIDKNDSQQNPITKRNTTK